MARKTLAPWIYFSALCVPDLDRLPGHEALSSGVGFSEHLCVAAASGKSVKLFADRS
jgi:hypothetical protein